MDCTQEALEITTDPHRTRNKGFIFLYGLMEAPPRVDLIFQAARNEAEAVQELKKQLGLRVSIRVLMHLVQASGDIMCALMIDWAHCHVLSLLIPIINITRTTPTACGRRCNQLEWTMHQAAIPCH